VEPAQRAPLLVARDQRVLALELAWPDDAAAGPGNVTLKRAAKPAPDAQARGEAWLSG
jgi:hypothetical protein